MFISLSLSLSFVFAVESMVALMREVKKELKSMQKLQAQSAKAGQKKKQAGRRGKRR
jgi:hypothetical protein